MSRRAYLIDPLQNKAPPWSFISNQTNKCDGEPVYGDMLGSWSGGRKPWAEAGPGPNKPLLESRVESDISSLHFDQSRTLLPPSSTLICCPQSSSQYHAQRVLKCSRQLLDVRTAPEFMATVNGTHPKSSAWAAPPSIPNGSAGIKKNVSAAGPAPSTAPPAPPTTTRAPPRTNATGTSSAPVNGTTTSSKTKKKEPVPPDTATLFENVKNRIAILEEDKRHLEDDERRAGKSVLQVGHSKTSSKTAWSWLIRFGVVLRRCS